MANYTNIERYSLSSEYRGYCGRAIWRIVRHGNEWRVTLRMVYPEHTIDSVPTTLFYAKTLREVSEKLEGFERGYKAPANSHGAATLAAGPL